MRVWKVLVLLAAMLLNSNSVLANENIKGAQILLKRGFVPTFVYWLIPADTDKKYMRFIARKAGLSQSQLTAQARRKYVGYYDLNYNVETGWGLDTKSATRLAKSIPSCYRRGTPWKDCKLRYHQIEGCYLTPQYRKACALGGPQHMIKQRYPQEGHGGYDLACWQAPKGDLPIVPVKAIKSRISLKTARRLDAEQKKSELGNYLKREVCPMSGAFQTRVKKYNHPVRLPKFAADDAYKPHRLVPWCAHQRKTDFVNGKEVVSNGKLYCGKEMARWFCAEHFYKGVKSFKKRSGLAATEFDFRTVCKQNCEGFASISCSKPNYIITGDYSETSEPAAAQAVPPVKLASLSPIKGFNLQESHDLIGDDLANMKNVDSVAACAGHCSAKTGCAAFSYDKWNRWCFLKSSAAMLRLEPKSVSGFLKAASQPSRSATAITVRHYRGKTFPNAPYKTVNAASFKSCKSVCVRERQCVAFSYVKKSRSCRLLNSAGEYFSKAGVDSGAKRQVVN